MMNIEDRISQQGDVGRQAREPGRRMSDGERRIIVDGVIMS